MGGERDFKVTRNTYDDSKPYDFNSIVALNDVFLFTESSPPP